MKRSIVTNTAVFLANSGISNECCGICVKHSGIWGQIQWFLKAKNSNILITHTGYLGRFSCIWGPIKQYLVKHSCIFVKFSGILGKYSGMGGIYSKILGKYSKMLGK